MQAKAASLIRTFELSGACKGAEDDATMAAKFSTLTLLQAHPKVEEFARYAAKQKATVGQAGAYGN